MQKDWVQYFKERANDIITQPMDAGGQLAAFSLSIVDITPTTVIYQQLSPDMSEAQLRAAWEANSMLAAHETMHAMARMKLDR